MNNPDNQAIAAAIAQEFEVPVEKLTPEANIKDTLELDSLSFVDLVALLETEFKVEISAQEITEIQTFQNLYDYIAAKAK